MLPDDPRHGKRAGYIAGCRCEPCGNAHRRYCKEYQLRASRSDGTTTVPVERVQPHLANLLTRMSMTAVGKAIGSSSSHVGRIHRGEIRRIHADTARRIVTMSKDAVPGGQYVTALGAARRIQGLHALGYSMQRLDALLGDMGRQNLNHIALGQRTWIKKATDDKIRATFERLSMRLPTAANHFEQAGITKARARAKRFGWAPPLAWTDIDDPNEIPTGHLPETREAREAGRLDAITEGDERGETAERIAADLGITPEALWRWCRRHGHDELWDRISARTRTVRNGSTGAAA